MVVPWHNYTTHEQCGRILCYDMICTDQYFDHLQLEKSQLMEDDSKNHGTLEESLQEQENAKLTEIATT